MSPSALVLQRLVYAGLDTVNAQMALDLSACLQTNGDDRQPQLYLRIPELSDLAGKEAARMVSEMRALAVLPPLEEVPTELGGFRAHVLVTGAPEARCVWVFGRRDLGLSAEELRVATAVTTAIGRVAETLAQPDAIDSWPGIIRLGVEAAHDQPRAEIVLSHRGDVVVGSGEGASAREAVARAVIDAIAPALDLIEADELRVGGEGCVVVLVRRADGDPGIGWAWIGTNPLHAAAIAAIHAVGPA